MESVWLVRNIVKRYCVYSSDSRNHKLKSGVSYLQYYWGLSNLQNLLLNGAQKYWLNHQNSWQGQKSRLAVLKTQFSWSFFHVLWVCLWALNKILTGFCRVLKLVDRYQHHHYNNLIINWLCFPFFLGKLITAMGQHPLYWYQEKLYIFSSIYSP